MATGTREDVVDLLLKQHDEIRSLLDTVERSSGERRKQKFDELRRLLAVHETAEEEVVHPYARRKLGGDDAVDELVDEEKKGKEVLKRLERVETGSPDFLPLFRRLRTSIEAHARHEEESEFPQLRIKGSTDELTGMATLVKAAESVAPTHPHPGAEGQAKNLALGPVAAVVARTRDAIHKARS